MNVMKTKDAEQRDKEREAEQSKKRVDGSNLIIERMIIEDDN